MTMGTAPIKVLHDYCMGTIESHNYDIIVLEEASNLTWGGRGKLVSTEHDGRNDADPAHLSHRAQPHQPAQQRHQPGTHRLLHRLGPALHAGLNLPLPGSVTAGGGGGGGGDGGGDDDGGDDDSDVGCDDDDGGDDDDDDDSHVDGDDDDCGDDDDGDDSDVDCDDDDGGVDDDGGGGDFS